METFYSRVTELCFRNGEKITPLTTSLGYSPGSIANWKKGIVPRKSVAQKFADHFGVEVEYLLTGRSNTMAYFEENKPGDSTSGLNEIRLNADEVDWLNLWRTLPAEIRLEFRAEMRGYLRAMEDDKRKKEA